MRPFKHLLAAAFAVSVANTAFAAPTLVFGDRPDDQAALTSDLTALGHSVTNVTTSEAEGLDFTNFDAVWAVNVFSNFDQLLPAVQDVRDAGGGIHFTGERECCEAANATIQKFLNANVIGGGIQVGGLGDAGSTGFFNPTAVGGITTNPNTLSTWNPNVSGRMGGVSGDNVLVAIDQATLGAVFDSGDLLGGVGRISVLMDTNWFSNTNEDPFPIVENMQTFLTNAASTPSQIPLPSTLLLLVAGTVLLAGSIMIGDRRVRRPA